MPSKSLRKNFTAVLTGELSKLYPQYEEKLKTVPDRRNFDLDLCSHGILSETDLLTAYVKATELPVIEEEDFRLTEIFPDISLDFLLYRCCLPYRWDDEKIEIAICEPYGIDELGYFFTRLHAREAIFSLAKRSHIERIINAVYRDEKNNPDEGPDIDISKEPDSEETLRSLASEAKIVRLVNEMFSRAAELDASDIHVEPDEKKLIIRFRIDGLLYEIMTPPPSLYPAIASRIKLIGGLNIAEKRLPQDGRTNLQIGRSNMDVRISTIPTMNGESVVLRILRKDTIDFNLKNIGMNAPMRKEFEKLISLPHGIILVVGPTGSGKSTTLYSVISRINTPDIKIITIEDPVEYRTEGIQQIQVNPKIGLDFAGGLRHIVRQDPDVILVGEIRDRETAEIAIHAALTGHLVLSTLHTNDAPGAISRLLDMGIESFLISSSLTGVLSQRLVRRICKVCDGKGSLSNANKCKNCNGSGFRGRIGIFELMVINDEIRKCINSKTDSATIARAAMKYGMRPLIEDGKEKVAEGITTDTEIAGVIVNLRQE